MINNNLLFFQKLGFLLICLAVLSFTNFLFKPSNLYLKEDLKLNLNKANFYQLVAVPYIGKKTALKIINLRKKLGYIKNIPQLKNIRNFNKFKYYLKVEGMD